MSLLNRLVFLMLVLAAISPAIAADNSNLTLVVPKTSGLSLSAVIHRPTEDASFSGKVWVRGLLIAQWPADLKHMDPRDQIEVTIKLDKNEFKHLPYYVWPQWKRSYIPDTVDILNHDEAITMAFPKKLSVKILNKKIQLVKVHARFLLGNYHIGVECDAPWAHAILLSAVVSEAAHTSTETDLDGC